MKYPECEKLKEVSEDSNKIGAFLDWLMYDKGIVLSKEYEGECEHCERSIDQLFPIDVNIEQLLADYFEIDLYKVEEERRKMLEILKKENNK